MTRFKTKVNETTIGCDPEVFFMQFGRVFPAIGLIGGSKEEPVPVEGGALQEDNVMAEFNTDPVTRVSDFINNINKVYAQLDEIAKANECELGIFASKTIDESIPLAFEEAKTFGCDPDFNAYTGMVNDTPDPESLLRTCAGHIHIGYDVTGKRRFTDSRTLVKYMDAFVGTWCVIHDGDTRRMTRYGKAGAFRHKPYGTEYRVPSNFWLKSDTLKAGIFRQTRRAYEAAYHSVELPKSNTIIDAINTANKDSCKEILSCLEVAA